MHNFIKCVKLQMKRGIKYYPAIAVFSIVLALSVIIIASGLFRQADNDGSQVKNKVGIVGDLNDTYLNMGIYAVQNFDSSKNYIDFIPLDRETAIDQLEKRQISGFIDVPPKFVDEILDGKDVKVKYVTLGGPAALGPLLVNEVAQMVSDIVVQSQNGVYGYMDYAASESDLSAEERSSIANQIAVEYAEHIFSRHNYYDTEIAEIYGKLSFKEYYICAFVCLILILFGITCTGFLTKSDMSSFALSKSRGISVLAQMLSEYFVFVLIIYANIILLFVSVGFADSLLNPGLSSVLGMDGMIQYLSVAVKLLPATVAICAVQFFLFSLTDGIVGSVLLQIFAAVALSFASGFLYPLNSLPDELRSIAPILPTTAVFNFIGEKLFGVFTDVRGITLFVISGILLFAAYISYRIRTRSAKV